MKKAINVLNRFKEPSTYAGLSGLFLAVGFTTDEFNTYVGIAAAVSGVVAMVLREIDRGE